MRISDWSSDVCSSDLAYSKQFAQELRLQSDFTGPFNFSLGGNYTKFRTQNDYYVMSNLLTALAMIGPFNETGTMTHCNRAAFDNRKGPAIPIAESGFCPYIDLNPVENRSEEHTSEIKSLMRISYAVFCLN